MMLHQTFHTFGTCQNSTVSLSGCGVTVTGRRWLFAQVGSGAGCWSTWSSCNKARRKWVGGELPGRWISNALRTAMTTHKSATAEPTLLHHKSIEALAPPLLEDGSLMSFRVRRKCRIVSRSEVARSNALCRCVVLSPRVKQEQDAL